MHLERLDLRQFRSFRDATVWFRPDLTVLVGENNGGKSNVVDAIRLMTASADGRRSRFCDPSDLRFGSEAQSFTLRGTYRGLSDVEQAMMITASDGVETGGIAHRLRYDLPTAEQRRGNTTWTVGSNDAVDPEPAARERIRHVYLPPLRDAQQALSSGSGDRIEFVLRSLAVGDELGGVETDAAQAFEDLADHPLIKRADLAVAEQLAELTAGTVPQASRLGFVDPSLRQLARALRMKLGEWGLDPTDLGHSGLGYANLLFLATVVVELAATRDADLTIFLVEEPEAHLHPQLQGAVLDFLIASARRDVDTPGSVQVIVTTHSAQLAASVPSEHVQVVKNAIADASSDGDQERQSLVVPIWRLNIADEHRRKVDRYLDATRSAMLFGARVLLVEGIAEVLLLPSIARRVLTDPQELARFRATALVGIDGVDFEPYVRVLLTPHGSIRVADRVVVVTDTDPAAPGDRVAALTALAVELNSADQLTVKASAITLEASLMQSGNAACIRDAFLAQRPQSHHVWDQDVLAHSAGDQPGRLVAMLKEKRVLKGDLAQHLAAYVEDPENAFSTPPYLEEAVKAVAAL